MKELDKRVGVLDTKLAKLSLESGTKSDKLIEVCSNIDLLKEASDRNVAEIKALCTERRESLTTTITSVPSDLKTHQKVIKGYASLKEKAIKEGWSSIMSGGVYLQRYLMSWGIEFRKDGKA